MTTNFPPARSCKTSRNFAGTASRPLLSRVSDVTPRNTYAPEKSSSPTITHFFPLGRTIVKTFHTVKREIWDFAFRTMTYREDFRLLSGLLSNQFLNSRIELIYEVISRKNNGNACRTGTTGGMVSSLDRLGGEDVKLACKPGSVQGDFPLGQSFLSTTGCPVAPAAYPGAARATLSLPYLALLRMGFGVPFLLPEARWALTRRSCDRPHPCGTRTVSPSPDPTPSRY